LVKVSYVNVHLITSKIRRKFSEHFIEHVGSKAKSINASVKQIHFGLIHSYQSIIGLGPNLCWVSTTKRDYYPITRFTSHKHENYYKVKGNMQLDREKAYEKKP